MYVCYRPPTQNLRLPAIQLHNRERCNPSPVRTPRRTCENQPTRAITASSCTHHHPASQEIVRTTSPTCYELDTCIYDNYCQCYSQPLLSSTNSTTTRIETLLRELLSACIEDETCACKCERYREGCVACEAESQTLVCELVDLLERGRGGERSALGTGLDWRCNSRHGRARGCCTGADRDRETETQTQTLFEVLFRITRRRKYRASSGSRSRHSVVCSRAQGRDMGLSRVVKQLLDELETSVGCECRSCHEYLEANTRRVRKALREIEGECGGRQGGCECVCGFSGGHAGDGAGVGCGCSGSVETVTKVVCERPLRSARSGNVHVGWSLR